jgi:hypothetical protein
MKTKEEVIKEAYPQKYTAIIDKDGWTNHVALRHFKKDELDSKIKEGRLIYRPKSLNGIETNNGWTKILSEADLPSESGDYYVEHKEHGNIYFTALSENYDRKLFFQEVIAYRPIEIPPKRVY